MKALILFCLLIGAVQIGCASSQSAPEGNGFRFYDKATQAIFVDRLKREGIAYRIRQDGTVLYSPSDESRVGEIRLAVVKDSFVPSAHFNDEMLEKRFIERLRSEGVKFGIQEKEGERWILWTEQDDDKVQKLRESILNSR